MEDRSYVSVALARGFNPDVRDITIGVVNDVLNTRFDSDMYMDKTSDITFGEAKRKIQKWIGMGHTSVIEHFVFSFVISTSRVTSHQLVRHRIASYTQKTMRIERDFNPQSSLVIPPHISNDPEDMKEWKQDMNTIINLYHKWLDKGYPVDVARRIVPSGFRTGLRMTINARSLRNLFEQRLHSHADFEIQEMARQMYKILYHKGFGFLFKDLAVVRLLHRRDLVDT
ncbi:MAG: FAD-dependent thymidylate synthase [Candidatus Lokiarchaeota archaeon]|nr:FAD-dependent thymidylate synthase [Candidatus Lokiarchaeota archaeon]